MKKDDYMDLDFSDIKVNFPLNRREFLKLLGGGIVILFSPYDSITMQESKRRGFRQRTPDDFDAFLRIGEDGRVTCLTGKIEMGQGAITSLAQILADELNVPLDSVDMVMGDTDLCPWDMGTFGSLSTRMFGPIMRAAAAEARAVLMELAAEYLKIPQNKLIAKDGLIWDKTQNKNTVSYAQLTKGKKIQRRLKQKAIVEKPSEFTIVGKPLLRRDALEKVTGEAKFAGDIRLSGLLYARILRPPAHRAELKSVNTTAAQKMKGVRVVQDRDLVAVLHEHPDEAEKALAKIKAQFKKPEAEVDDTTIFDHLVNVAPEGEIVAQGGNLAQGKKLASEIFEEKYLNSYVAHSPIETHTAVAKIEGDKATVWVSTQRPFGDQESVAQAIGLPTKNVRIITPFVGGGFGGKTSNRQAIEAAQLAKLTGKPVQVAWTRPEEFFYDTFRPAAVVKIKSGINGSGKIVHWDYMVYYAGERGSEQFYEIPHHRTVFSGGGWRGTPGSHPFRTGAWRAPANNTNTFARESHIDIMASKAGIDPLEFRLKHFSHKRVRSVLEHSANKIGQTLD